MGIRLRHKCRLEYLLTLEYQYCLEEKDNSVGRRYQGRGLHAPVGCRRFRRCRTRGRGCARRCDRYLRVADGRPCRFRTCSSTTREHHSASRRNHRRSGIAKTTEDWRTASYRPFFARGIRAGCGRGSGSPCSGPMAKE